MWEVQGEASGIEFGQYKTRREAELAMTSLLQQWKNQYGPDDDIGLRIVRVELTIPLE